MEKIALKANLEVVTGGEKLAGGGNCRHSMQARAPQQYEKLEEGDDRGKERGRGGREELDQGVEIRMFSESRVGALIPSSPGT